MKTIQFTAEHEKFLNQAHLCKIIELNGNHYVQVSEIQMRPGTQYVAVIDIENENVIVKNGMALVEIPDEGFRMGVLVVENNRVRFTAIVPADVAVSVSGDWNNETTSNWIESQFNGQ